MYIIVHPGVLVPFREHMHAGLRTYAPSPLLVASLMVCRVCFYTSAEYITCNMKARNFILRV